MDRIVLRVRAERQKRGWTQHEVAMRARVWGPTLSNIECGTLRPKPTSPVMQRLARLYGVPAKNLLQPVRQ